MTRIKIRKSKFCLFDLSHHLIHLIRVKTIYDSSHISRMEFQNWESIHDSSQIKLWLLTQVNVSFDSSKTRPWIESILLVQKSIFFSYSWFESSEVITRVMLVWKSCFKSQTCDSSHIALTLVKYSILKNMGWFKPKRESGIVVRKTKYRKMIISKEIQQNMKQIKITLLLAEQFHRSL